MVTSFNREYGLQPAGQASIEAPRPRICMPTSRNFSRKAFQCGLYEAQDVLQEIDDVDLICLEPGRGFRFKERWQRRLLYRDVSRRLIFMNPGLHKVRLTREYDLFVVVCQNYWDLLYLSAIDGWKDHCKTSVCWIDEMYASDIPGYKYWLHSLQRFDYVFLCFSGSVASFSKASGRSCRWLPAGVDALRFSPYPNPPSRVIDVYCLGRRWERMHQSLLQAAERREIFYVYDTTSGSDLEVYDHRQHRDFLANMAKRSRYFVVAPARLGLPELTHGQVEIGYRYYEGATAGAVMIGQPADSEAFSQMFDWPDAVIQLQPDGSDVIDVLAGLASDLERVSAISRRNAKEALLRHDWVYRWKEIFRITGIDPSPRMAARERLLKQLADLAANPAHDRAIVGAPQ